MNVPMQFDRIAILDWSAAGKPKTGRDSIWLGITDAFGTETENIPTRLLAESALSQLIEECLNTGKRLLIGVDFALSAPKGFTERVTGAAHPFALWSFLRERIIEGPDNFTNYRDVAAEMNAAFDEDGPFWGNTTRQDILGLPRTKPPLPQGIETYRRTEVIARHEGAMPKTLWQLAGAGAVGAQSLTGMAMLSRLKAVQPAIKVWPFEAPDLITVAEVYPSLIAEEVRAATDKDSVPDQLQVALLSKALFHLSSTGRLAGLMEGVPTDGAILGAGQGHLLRAALPKAPAPKSTPKARRIPLTDLPSAIAALDLPRPKVEKTTATDLIGRVLAQDLSAGSLKAKTRVPPKALPLLIRAGLGATPTFAPLCVAIAGPWDALLGHVLRANHARIGQCAALPPTASRIKARLTALALEHDLVICRPTQGVPALEPLLTDEPLFEIAFTTPPLAPLRVILWKGTPLVILPESGGSDALFVGLVLGPLVRSLGGENVTLRPQKLRVASKDQSGLVFGTRDGERFIPLPQLPEEEALASSTHIAILTEQSPWAEAFALCDLGLA